MVVTGAGIVIAGESIAECFIEAEAQSGPTAGRQAGSAAPLEEILGRRLNVRSVRCFLKEADAMLLVY